MKKNLSRNMHSIKKDATEWKELPQSLCLEFIFSRDMDWDTIYL